jgi:hypothetical protein
MDNISRMDVLCGFEQLVHDETFVDILQNGTSPDHIMQVSICKHTQESTNQWINEK